MALVSLSLAQYQRLSYEQSGQLVQNAWLLKTGVRADCSVSCEGSTVYLHREILCERSGFFRAAFASGFQESLSGVLDLKEVVTSYIVGLIIQYIYLSIPKAAYDLEVYGPMDDAQFYELALELYRQADYLRVISLTNAIIKEIKKRLDMSARLLFRKQRNASGSEVFKKAHKDPMTAAILAYDKSNEYYDLYEPVRAEFFSWIERCYPVLCRLGDEFEDYLRDAPELSLTILKRMRNIEGSKFISPGPEARCMFCNHLIWQEVARYSRLEQPRFGVVADGNGRARYFCERSACFRKISSKRCFQGPEALSVRDRRRRARWLPY